MYIDYNKPHTNNDIIPEKWNNSDIKYEAYPNNRTKLVSLIG